MLSIASLIYRSPEYADSVWASAHENTPHLKDGRARFFFIANDATPGVIKHLVDRGYPHVIQENAVLKDAELADLGLRPPEYIRRVYQGYNRALMESEEQAVLVNSDHIFSPGWLEGLLEFSTPARIVCSQLVERTNHKFTKFPRAYTGNFGGLKDFNKTQFLAFAKNVSMKKIEADGAYQPCLVYRDKAIEAGLYPEGNTRTMTGDKDFFRRLREIGVQHVTAANSIVYHFKEGERDA